MNPRRLWWLTVYDSSTGCATRIVGVVGAEGGDRRLSWLPHEDDVRLWLQRLGSPDVAAARPADWPHLADGVVVGMVPIDRPPASRDLAGSVEAALDSALTAAVVQRRAS